MDVLDFDEWPSSTAPQMRTAHPLLAEAITTLKTTDKVLRFTEADLEGLPNKSLPLLEQRLRALAKKEGFRITAMHRRDLTSDTGLMYVRRNTAKRR